MKTASSAEPDQATSNLLGYKGVSLWLGVAAGFLLLVLAWSVLFSVARSTKVESVPLATKGGRP